MISNIAAYLSSMFGLPDEPIARRRRYWQLVFLFGIIGVAGVLELVEARVISFVLGNNDRELGPLLAGGFIIILAGFGAAAFFSLQLFLEFGGASSPPRRSLEGDPVDDQLSALAEDEGAERTRSASEASRPSSVVEIPRFIRVATAMRSRLRSEIRAQGRKANTNLSVGVVTAGLGLAILAWLALESSATAHDVAKALAAVARPASDTSSAPPPMLYWGQFAAKAALSISANVFSFFFLSTYRRNLAEIKYFQNEMTNVESHLVALFYAHNRKFGDVEKNIMLKMADVERNFILKKGETTVDVKLRELDVGEIASMLAMSAKTEEHVEAKRSSGTKSPSRRKSR